MAREKRNYLEMRASAGSWHGARREVGREQSSGERGRPERIRGRKRVARIRGLSSTTRKRWWRGGSQSTSSRKTKLDRERSLKTTVDRTSRLPFDTVVGEVFETGDGGEKTSFLAGLHGSGSCRRAT